MYEIGFMSCLAVGVDVIYAFGLFQRGVCTVTTGRGWVILWVKFVELDIYPGEIKTFNY